MIAGSCTSVGDLICSIKHLIHTRNLLLLAVPSYRPKGRPGIFPGPVFELYPMQQGMVTPRAGSCPAERGRCGVKAPDSRNCLLCGERAHPRQGCVGTTRRSRGRMQGERAKNGTGKGAEEKVRGWGLNSHGGLCLCAGHGTALGSGGKERGKRGCGCRAV